MAVDEQYAQALRELARLERYAAALEDAAFKLLEWDRARNYIVPYRVRDPLIAAMNSKDATGVTEGPAPRWWHCKHCQLEAPTENVNLGPTHKTCGYEVTPATLGVTRTDDKTKDPRQ